MMRVTSSALLLVTSALAAFLFSMLWYFPLTVTDSIFTSDQLELYSDQNFYMHYAREFCREPPQNWADYNVTWSSHGIMIYLSSACRVGGSPFSYLLPSLISFILAFKLALKTAVRVAERPGSHTICAPFLIPVTLYYVLLPGKEIFSIISTLLLFSSLLIAGDDKRRGCLCFLGALAVSFFSRPHEALIVAAIGIAFLLYRRGGLFAVALAAVFGLSSIDLLLVNVVNRLMGTSLSGFSDQLVVTPEGIGYLLVSENPLIHGALGLPRSVYLLLGVIYKSFAALSEIQFSWYSIFRDWPIILRAVDFLFVFNVVSRYKKYNIRIFGPAIFIFAGYLFMITLWGVEEKSRYVFPLILPIFISSFFKSKGGDSFRLLARGI
ncbi:MAG: hypothetical protein FJ184_05095 [Gammaproteobacteria bacterium]|nr:hypothetical protein [Gammaproteobacteria bacterium]